jgi:hypothetical protein
VTDSATLRGPNVSSATGTVTYSVYSDNACTVSAGSGGTVTVAAGSVPASTSVSLSTPGTYYWQASYSGDSANAASKSTCGSEVETVRAPQPQPTHIQTALVGGTVQSGWWNGDILSVSAGTAVTDSTTLTGANASSAGGTVTYTVYQDQMCSSGRSHGGSWHDGSNRSSNSNYGSNSGQSQCAPTVVGTDTETVTAGVVPNSKPVTLDGAGFYSWQVSYSGDATNAPSQSAPGSETEIVKAPEQGSPS